MGGRRCIANDNGCGVPWAASPDAIEVLHRRRPVACTRLRRHRVKCSHGTGGASWRGGSSRESSSLRRAPDQGSRRVVCAGVARPGRAYVAAARLGEEAGGRSAACLPRPCPRSSRQAPIASRRTGFVMLPTRRAAVRRLELDGSVVEERVARQ